MPATIILTRPQHQAERFADDLRNTHGSELSILIAPLMKIESVKPIARLGAPDHLIFTSANAVAQLSRFDLPRTATAWCVGQQTADAARAAGFAVEVGDGDARALTAKIIAAHPKGRFLHLHGAHATGHVAQTLSDAGLPCRAEVVYAQNPVPQTPALQSALTGGDSLIFPIFSPRSARLLGEATQNRGSFCVIAISDAAAQIVADWQVNALITANFPDKSSMIDATLRAYDAQSGGKTA